MRFIGLWLVASLGVAAFGLACDKSQPHSNDAPSGNSPSSSGAAAPSTAATSAAVATGVVPAAAKTVPANEPGHDPPEAPAAAPAEAAAEGPSGGKAEEGDGEPMDDVDDVVPVGVGDKSGAGSVESDETDSEETEVDVEQ